MERNLGFDMESSFVSVQLPTQPLKTKKQGEEKGKEKAMKNSEILSNSKKEIQKRTKLSGWS